MQIRKSDDLWVKERRDGNIFSSFSGIYKLETETDKIDIVKKALKVAKSRTLSDGQKDCLYTELLRQYKDLMPSEEILKQQEEQSRLKVQVSACLINFFKDFEFDPSYRFVNTLQYHSSSVKEAQKYVYNYFNLADNQYKNDVKEKMKSYEFEELISNMKQIKSSKKVNSRLKIYYGPQGAGKTTKGIEETNNNVIVCNSAMLPSDLLEDFDFDDGKAGFYKSALCKAMEEGKLIMLDEINLLPFESIRFLQGITDNKANIIYKGKTINIKEGFKIIGTMNLYLNGTCYGLPEPLLDRASDLEEFKLTAEQLANAF